MAGSDDKLPSLETLQHEIDEAKSRAGIGKHDAAEAEAQENLGKAMRLGLELVAGVAVGSTAGYFIDRWLHTMPVFFIICFFLGAAAGFRNLLRDAGVKLGKDDTK